MIELTIRRATINDAPELLTLLESTAAALRERGINQWNDAMFTIEGITRSITNHDVFLAYNGEILAGTVRLQWSDPLIWADLNSDTNAAYVHRLAIDPDFAGQGIGRQLLSFTEDHAKANGKTDICLDC